MHIVKLSPSPAALLKEEQHTATIPEDWRHPRNVDRDVASETKLKFALPEPPRCIPWAARLFQGVMNAYSFLGFQFSGVGKRQGKALATVAPFCHAHSKPSGWCEYSTQLRHEFAQHSASPSSYQFQIKLEITSSKNLMEECYWQRLRFFFPPDELFNKRVCLQRDFSSSLETRRSADFS